MRSPRALAAALVAHLTERICRRYAINDEAMFKEGVAKLARFHGRARCGAHGEVLALRAKGACSGPRYGACGPSRPQYSATSAAPSATTSAPVSRHGMTGHKTASAFQRYNIMSDGDLHEAAWRLDSAVVDSPTRRLR